MSNSPYLPADIKEYIKKHNIEGLIKDAVDQLLREKKDDPYSFLMTYFGKLGQSTMTLETVHGTEILNNEGLPSVQLNFIVTYKAQQWKCSPKVHFNQSNENQTPLYDGDQTRFQGKGMLQAIELLNKINPIIKGLGKIQMVSIYIQHSINVVQPISFSLASIQAQLTNQTLNSVLKQVFAFQPQQYLPKIFVNLLQGSKLFSSKCKVFRFLLTIQDQSQVQNILNYTQLVTQNLRKILAAGKQGEAGIKYHQDGTFLCPADTIADNLKIIEQSIDQAGLKDKVGIGLVWMADLFYIPEQKKYELENPKQLLDTDQLIDFYYKLCSERPMINYFEDPIISEDIIGWQKILLKFQDHKVKIGSRKLYSSIEDVKRLSETLIKESHPDMTEEEIADYNSKKIHLQYIHLKPYDYPTFSQFSQIIQYLQMKKPMPTIILGDTMTDTTDTQIVNLAFSINNAGINMTGPSKYEKLNKYSEFLYLTQEGIKDK